MNELKKEIGDLVQINAGTYKDKTGTLVEKGKGWVVELADSKERISVSFPMVTLIQKAQPATQEAAEPDSEVESKPESTELSQTATETVISETAPAETSTEAKPAESEPESETPLSSNTEVVIEETTPAETTADATQQTSESPAEEVTVGEAATEITTEEPTSGETGSAEQTPATATEQENVLEIDPEIKKLTINQLQALAKEKGVSIARTKEDFIRIIKQKNPSENLNLLKGKVLFDRVTELKISRLRSKADLQRLLSK